MVKTIMKRYLGAGIAHTLEALIVGRRRVSEASNYRVTHLNISVFFETTWDKIVAMYYFEHGPGMENTNIGAVADATAKALHTNCPGEVRQIPRRETRHVSSDHINRGYVVIPMCLVGSWVPNQKAFK